MSTAADSAEGLGDASDPTYTHFAHRDEFLALLQQVLAYDLGENIQGDGSAVALKKEKSQEEEEDRLIKLMGAIVRT
jgi:hypothetical protein